MKMKKQTIIHNQFFGMMLVAVGIGALIVVARYLIISTQGPGGVYVIQEGDLIPGAQD